MKTMLRPLTPFVCCLFPWTGASAAESARTTAPSAANPATIFAARDLPLPFGVSLLYFHQEQDYAVTGLQASSAGFPISGFDATAITRIENSVDQVSAKFDWWALPWLNFHAVVGRVSGEATAGLAPAVQGLLGGSQSLNVGYDGVVFGTGVTLAAGYRCFFASMTASYTWANIDMKDGVGLSLDDPTGIETLVLSPKIGIRNHRGALWVGAWYQYTGHTQAGNFSVSSLPAAVQFKADATDKTSWSFLVGGELSLSKHWSLTAEGGFGDRQQVLVGTAFRF